MERLDQLVKVIRYAGRKYSSWERKQGDDPCMWNEKHADYWKGRRDGL